MWSCRVSPWERAVGMAEAEARPVVIPDLDIYRSAKLLIDQHGDEVSIEAAMRADAMLGYSVCSSVDACA